MSGTTPTMTCEIFGDRLMDFLEGDVDGATGAALEAHARSCAACGALLADLRRLSADASHRPTLTPSRDLWSGIAARIDTPVVTLAERRPFWKSPRVVSLAVAAAVVFAAALGYEMANRGVAGPTGAGAPAQRTAALPSPTADTALPAAAATVPMPMRAPAPTAARLAANRAANATPAAVEKSYDAEIAGLRTIVNSRRSRLDSTTVAVIEKNLAVIDSAIAQCKVALSKDPASRFLMQSLSQSLDTKVQLLRIAAALPSST